MLDRSSLAGVYSSDGTAARRILPCARDRILLGTLVVLGALVFGPKIAAQCSDPCSTGAGQCDCMISFSYMCAIPVQCCCGWFVCMEGVWVESEQFCSWNCYDDVFYCVNEVECAV